MKKYYTRACNFYYGSESKLRIKKKLSLPLNGNSLISFDCIELINRKSKKIINIKKINNLPKVIKNKVIIISAIDNLIKGASGQAVQNMNVACKLKESLGLV